MKTTFNCKELSKKGLTEINGGSWIYDLFVIAGRAFVRDGVDSTNGDWTSVKYGSWNY